MNEVHVYVINPSWGKVCTFIAILSWVLFDVSRFTMRVFSALSFLSIVGLTLPAEAVDETGSINKLIQCLKSSLSPQGSVVLPGNSLFTSDVSRFSSFEVPSFRVVSQATNEHDVRASVGVQTLLRLSSSMLNENIDQVRETYRNPFFDYRPPSWILQRLYYFAKWPRDLSICI